MKELQRITENYRGLELLQQKISGRGYTLEALAEDMGCTPERLEELLAGSQEATGSEIAALARLLHMSRQERDQAFLLA